MEKSVRHAVIAAVAIVGIAIAFVAAATLPRTAQADYDAYSYPPVVHQTYLLEDGSKVLASASAPGRVWVPNGSSAYDVVDAGALLSQTTENPLLYRVCTSVDEAVGAQVAGEGYVVCLLEDACCAFDFSGVDGIIDEFGDCTMLLDVQLNGFALDFAQAVVPEGYRIAECGTVDNVTTYTLVRL